MKTVGESRINATVLDALGPKFQFCLETQTMEKIGGKVERAEVGKRKFCGDDAEFLCFPVCP